MANVLYTILLLDIQSQMETCNVHMYSLLRLALYIWIHVHVHKRGFISARGGISRVYQSREEQEGDGGLWNPHSMPTLNEVLYIYMYMCVGVHILWQNTVEVASFSSLRMCLVT